ncbi:MAG: cell division FtsA domain-containing protein [Patescibacteria group bacterium]
MIRNISIGIDVGTTTTRIVVGEFLKGQTNPNIIGIGEYATAGMRHGYIVSFSDVVKSIKGAVAMAEKTSGIKVKKAFVSISSITMRGDISTGSAIISKADNEVTLLDVNKALGECEDNLHLGNKKLLHTFPISFKLDGKEVHGRVEGMRGTKLEVKALLVTCSNQHFEDLISAVAEAGIDILDVVASPIAGAQIALSKKQKMVGGGLVNIGSETMSLVIFENEVPIALHSFSIGGSDITNDLALGFKTTLEQAESLKIGNNTQAFPKKKIDEIVGARLTDIFELIENHLKKIKRSELLPAGVAFIGGGAKTFGLEELSKTYLKLPSRIGDTDFFGTTKTKLRDPFWFVALGLILVGKNNNNYYEGTFSNFFKDFKNTLKGSLKQLLP